MEKNLKSISNHSASDVLPEKGVDRGKTHAWHLDFSLPFICVAIHGGHNIRPELKCRLALDRQQQEFEQDTATPFMIRGLANRITALDSRIVYDLNRPPDRALPLTPERFWGTKVYKTLPTARMNQKSLACYKRFYRFMETCVRKMLKKFNTCIIYDIHSYNISRQKASGIDPVPVFNLGTALVDTLKWEKQIASWLDLLHSIKLPGIETSVAQNLVFSGQGELCRRFTAMDKRILVLPTEIAKIYMDETTGTIYPEILNAIKTGLEKAVLSHISYYI